MKRNRGPWRLRVLQAGILLAALVIGARLFEIQFLRHEEFRQRADDQWRSSQRLEPERGNMYDRAGRPLAMSVTTWRIGVATERVTDPASFAAALAPILAMDEKELTGRIARSAGRHLVLARGVSLSREDRQTLRLMDGVTLDALRRRVYPLGGTGASLIGFHRPDGPDGESIGTGLERGLDSYLGGQAGQAWQLRAPLGRDLGRIVLKQPRHGLDLVLTVDADLQEICEAELARSVEETHALGGCVMVADPATGDVLAAASWPLLSDRSETDSVHARWNSCCFTSQFEPGSVLKIFSAASLLSHGAIDTATVFDCSDGDFGRFHIRNSDGHVYGHLGFMEAFAHSSNIYFARAATNLDKHEFYRDLTAFGFGQRTGFPYAAQPKGLLSDPDEWSHRSKPTIAIGQEIAVTPLQLIMAACAVANGGELYAPRIVREIRDHDGVPVKSVAPAKLRRVVSEPLAALLREAMRRTVAHGTGVAASRDWIELGGKTGTAQLSVDGRGYTQGCYTASFIGMAPIDRPRLVILTILDRPDYAHHYAAQSAAPLFARIVGEARRTTNWLTDATRDGLVAGIPRNDERLTTVPDVMFLSVSAAGERLARAGLHASRDEIGGLVVGQVPAAGTSCREGTPVALTVRVPDVRDDSARPICPDLAGLSNRQVVGIAARLGVPLRIEGAGYVASQTPPPSMAIGTDGIEVKMVKAW